MQTGFTKCLLVLFDRFVQGVQKEEVWEEHSLTEAWRQIQARVRKEREQEGGDADQDGGDPDGETELDVILARSEGE